MNVRKLYALVVIIIDHKPGLNELIFPSEKKITLFYEL